MINKFFFIKGGAERYYFELKSILEAKGHTVIPFSMQHPRNEPSIYSSYFVDYIDFNPATLPGKIRVGISSLHRILYFRQAQRRLTKLIRETQPDIAHLHMIDHQISPSILPVLFKAGIPVVQTVHTYKHVCPSYRLYHMKKGGVCEKCVGGSYRNALIERCHRGSFWATLLIVLETALHRRLRLTEKYVDLLIPPSHFMAKMLERGGFDPRKIRQLFYTLQIDSYPRNLLVEPYFVFYGRLSEEKGITTLIEAMKGMESGRLKIIGEGPMFNMLKNQIQTLGLDDHVELTGAMHGEELMQTVAKCQFVVVPSEWYENSPLVIYESFAMGKPVIGADIGGIPELIRHGENGYLFPAGDAGKLRECIHYFLENQEHLAQYGKAARKTAEKWFDPDLHYGRIMEIYKAQMIKKKGPELRSFQEVS
jgi:glycosyltransferase involved in cell wall biosynthesis